MAIVKELQEEALKSNADILALLRKSFLIARKLDLKEFQEWINNELYGYKDINKIPEYRNISGTLQRQHSIGVWDDIHILNNKLRLNSRAFLQPISALNGLLSVNTNNEEIGIDGNEFKAYLDKKLGINTIYRILISKSEISNIIEQIQTKILDWAITLEENGILGEGLEFTNEEKFKAQSEPQIVNYISIFLDSVTGSQIQQGTINSKQKLVKIPQNPPKKMKKLKEKLTDFFTILLNSNNMIIRQFQ